MKLLLIDTCGMTGSVALADTTLDSPITATATLAGRSASEQLVATIREMSATVGVNLHSLDAIAVVSGPGSFTGVRVGLSAAKGLCGALNLPLIAISRLAVLADNSAAPIGTGVFAVLDAGRGEFYLRIHTDEIPITEALVTSDQLINTIKATGNTNGTPPILSTCEPAIAEAFAHLKPLLLPEPTAVDALPLILRRLKAYDFDDVATIDANYLRRTDAEIFAKRTITPNSASIQPAAQAPTP
jgi:tRNA threonylcarbamoyladenosine biosynthesis protein TsaB